MLIVVKKEGLSETGKLMAIKILRKKINGVHAMTYKGIDEAFFPYEDIKIMWMSEEEKQMPIDY